MGLEEDWSPSQSRLLGRSGWGDFCPERPSLALLGVPRTMD